MWCSKFSDYISNVNVHLTGSLGCNTSKQKGILEKTKKQNQPSSNEPSPQKESPVNKVLFLSPMLLLVSFFCCSEFPTAHSGTPWNIPSHSCHLHPSIPLTYICTHTESDAHARTLPAHHPLQVWGVDGEVDGQEQNKKRNQEPAHSTGKKSKRPHQSVMTSVDDFWSKLKSCGCHLKFTLLLVCCSKTAFTVLTTRGQKTSWQSPDELLFLSVCRGWVRILHVLQKPDTQVCSLWGDTLPNPPHMLE